MYVCVELELQLNFHACHERAIIVLRIVQQLTLMNFGGQFVSEFSPTVSADIAICFVVDKMARVVTASVAHVSSANDTIDDAHASSRITLSGTFAMGILIRNTEISRSIQQLGHIMDVSRNGVISREASILPKENLKLLFPVFLSNTRNV